MKVIERDADSSPKIVLATREEIEQAGYSIAGYDVGKLLGEIEGVLGISVYEKRKPWPCTKSTNPPRLHAALNPPGARI